jgi:purine-binding chemotaxis protein CheW
MAIPNDAAGGHGPELIEVRIGAQRYAIDIMAVREIRGWTASTPLPHAPPHVLGMINLRGAILPVVDLGARLGMGATKADSASVVVVAHVIDHQVGLLVDAVCDILTIPDGALQATPDVGSGEAAAYVSGVMTTADGIVSVLSLDDIFASDARQAA